MDQVTRTLAGWASSCSLGHIPEGVRTEGVRTFVNWLGCAVGACRHETVERALAPFGVFSGRAAGNRARPRRPSRRAARRARERHQLARARLRRHASQDRHPSDRPGRLRRCSRSPSAPSLGRGASCTRSSLGVEVECRIGNSVYPDHYDVGWHITGTAGVFGAAAAAGRLLGLDRAADGVGARIAATQSSGLREMFGTMCKSFHPGRAAQNGPIAALLAQPIYELGAGASKRKRGFAQRALDQQDYSEITHGLGETWEVALNTYKPFACGIVIHPIIDGCIQLRDEHGRSRARSNRSSCGAPAGARAHRKEDPAGPVSKAIQRLSTRPRSRSSAARLPSRLQRRGGERSEIDRAARPRHGRDRPVDARGPDARRRSAEGRADVREARRARDRQPRSPDERAELEPSS